MGAGELKPHRELTLLVCSVYDQKIKERLPLKRLRGGFDSELGPTLE